MSSGEILWPRLLAHVRRLSAARVGPVMRLAKGAPSTRLTPVNGPPGPIRAFRLLEVGG